MRAATRRMTAFYDAALEPAGVNAGQFGLLRKLSAAGPVSIQQLARAVELERSTVARNVRVLEKSGLVSLTTAEEKAAIGAAIQSAIVEVIDVPDTDRYQLFTEYQAEDFRHTDSYLGLEYSEQLLIIEIAIVEGRSDELKKSLLATINQKLVATGAVRTDDVFVVITEFGRANVTFGRGLAQRAD